MGYGSAYAGVATATKPTGPFTFLKAGRVNPGKWPMNMDKKDPVSYKHLPHPRNPRS